MDSQIVICPICSKELLPFHSLKDHLKFHYYTMNDPKNTKFLAHDFNYFCKLNTPKSLQCKLNIPKSLQCKLCSKILKTPTTFKIHMNYHYQIRNFHCKFCSSKFVERSSLNRHTKIHLQIKAYHCPLCTWKFTQSSDLKSHLKNHK